MPSFERAGSVMFVLLLLLGACAAPPTQQQVTSRAIQRNCEVRGMAAADAIRRQNVQLVKEGTADESDRAYVDSRADQARERTFRSCMLESAV